MKQVNMLDSKTRKVLYTFDSLKEAAHYVAVTQGRSSTTSIERTISKICNGVSCKHNYYGYGWSFGK